MGRRRVSSFRASAPGAAQPVVEKAGSVPRRPENCPVNPRRAPGFNDQVNAFLLSRFSAGPGQGSPAGSNMLGGGTMMC